jgi:hypothetical protein
LAGAEAFGQRLRRRRRQAVVGDGDGAVFGCDEEVDPDVLRFCVARGVGNGFADDAQEMPPVFVVGKREGRVERDFAGEAEGLLKVMDGGLKGVFEGVVNEVWAFEQWVTSRARRWASESCSARARSLEALRASESAATASSVRRNPMRSWHSVSWRR